jgi:DNA segregation ATPase FtsK/SpoIIIE, S-DNA-T family
MIIVHLAPLCRGRLLVPVLGKVASTRYTDRIAVRLVSGQSPADFATRAENLAHSFGAIWCRVRTGRPGCLVLEFVRRDALAAIFPPRCRSPHALICERCRSASGRTAACGLSGCWAPMC